MNWNEFKQNVERWATERGFSLSFSRRHENGYHTCTVAWPIVFLFFRRPFCCRRKTK